MRQTIKLSIFIILPLLLIVGWVGLNSGNVSVHNPYNLDLVTSTTIYRQQVQANPENSLLDIPKEIPGIVTDIRYATSNNFTGKVIYTMPKAFARKRVVESLRLIQDSLNKLGLGLKMYDAYRPYTATLLFYKVYPDTNFVASPRTGSRHNRGCAVDVSLISLATGKEIRMPTPFDEFSERANPDFMKLDQEVIQNRSLLKGIMEHFGFSNLSSEWWHYDFRGWKDYPLMDIPFEQLKD